jgi:hypothetical protein
MVSIIPSSFNSSIKTFALPTFTFELVIEDDEGRPVCDFGLVKGLMIKEVKFCGLIQSIGGLFLKGRDRSFGDRKRSGVCHGEVYAF